MKTYKKNNCATDYIIDRHCNDLLRWQHGINEANNKMRSYFVSGTNLIYAVEAVLGLIGAVKLYSKLNKADSGKVAVAWFGSCVFLAVVATVIRSFFGTL